MIQVNEKTSLQYLEWPLEIPERRQQIQLLSYIHDTTIREEVRPSHRDFARCSGIRWPPYLPRRRNFCATEPLCVPPPPPQTADYGSQAERVQLEQKADYQQNVTQPVRFHPELQVGRSNRMIVSPGTPD